MFPTITIEDFAHACTESSLCDIKIWDLNKDGYVFEGTLQNAVQEFWGETVQSFDPPVIENGKCILVINIDTSED